MELFIIVISIAAFIMLILFFEWMKGKNHQRYKGAPSRLSHWMSDLPDDKKLTDLIIPGSHDSGTLGLLWAGETQNYSLSQQLLCGVRYFDIRIGKIHDSYRIFHSIANGDSFDNVIEAMYDFIKKHPTEVILLDFQHFKGNSQDHVREVLEQTFLSENLLVSNTTPLTNLAFIHQLTLGDVRGKCIAFWGDRDYPEYPYLFKRNDNECTFENMCLDSYYIAPLHKRDSATLLHKAHSIYFDRANQLRCQESNGIFVLQSQLTDGIVIRGPWSREKKHDPLVSEYIRRLPTNPNFELVNVIMRDFITPQKCSDIIELNHKNKF